MRSIIALLLLYAYSANGQVFRPSLPGILSIVRFQNTACNGDNGDTGTCLTETDCNRRAGTAIGPCANGFGACCSFKFTCGGTTNQNETVFVNPAYPRGENGTDTCQVTIEKQPNVCQLRLDFEEFTVAQPDEHGLCTTDSFMVRTTVGERLPILCGENGGQHIYIDMGRGSANPVVLSVVSNGDRVTRKWKIKINMIPCNNLDMAPSGCMQYYRSPSAIIRSFNYGPKIENRSRYLSNLRYTACVRVEENFCAIKWETDSPNSFSFGAPFSSNIKDAQFGNYTELIGGTGGFCSLDDFIGIDQGSNDGVGPGEDRFCGNRLLDSNMVISRSKPFQLKVRSNADQSLNAANSQQGFSLRYVQLPCVI
ncbi:hypothetical protein B4U79_01466 [Dinothrombium tinctorium]|uniref:CUB domain-containing protein n=1 Tax=Dinothrombium tinctorium TaxID=1965070 RepID=A0A443R4Z9_9ACAR|nr:hypothetical protein B4U79_15477 [Dinothrombium tinctorium]RWS13678.1 hypothetical protein B4U79_01466 [Dinothrombium tinctorium]